MVIFIILIFPIAFFIGFVIHKIVEDKNELERDNNREYSRYNHGMYIDTSGSLRVIKLADGYYVAGVDPSKGNRHCLIPFDSEEKADRYVERRASEYPEDE